MKRVIGIDFIDNMITPIEVYVSKCICVEKLEWVDAVLIGGIQNHPQTMTLNLTRDGWEIGKLYEYSISDGSEINPYLIFLEGDYNRLTKEDFDNHFKSVEDFRNDKIENILK